jgi:hypothetical protein
MPSSPIHLTDDQLTAIFAASHPLQPNQRSQFLEACAQELAQLGEIGDGAVHRVVSAVQKRFFDPPEFDHDNGVGKYNHRLVRRRRVDPHDEFC